ncbi:MAG: hypothetical protein JRI23_32525 [Deltaproteobacteria bacterium]|jgi:aldehyde:ferredoxin oxidoreductase|nr:hypothetical protein [Deltaproteobacteria bacterium]MBW2536971.1 hypothetical protein [Deltaproteobacteria bacterium]
MSFEHGWAGKILFVDLTTGQIHTEPTEQWLPARIGAIGIGLDILWERVPAAAGPFDPDNLLYIGVGPLTGSWAPCAGRAVAVSLSPAGYPVEHVGQSSVGGQWPAELKWAGYDGVVIAGRAPHPQYLAIHDEQVALRDARHLWGESTFVTQQTMQQELRDERAKALVIGPAGERRGRNATMIHGTGHALGQCGMGGVAGSKRLKGIVVRGTGRVTTAVPLADFRGRLREIRGMLALMQSVISADRDGRSRWRAREGLAWRGGDEEVPIGPIAPDDLARQGLRHCGTDFYMGGLLRDWHVKNSGCTGCVMNCFSTIRGQLLPKGIPEHGEAHCVQMQTGIYARVRDDVVVSRASPQTVFTAKQMTDLVGVNSYDVRMLLPLLVQARFGHEGSYFAALDDHLRTDLESLPWESIEEGGDQGLAMYLALYERMRTADPDADDLGAWLLQGTPRLAARFGMMDDVWTGAHGQARGFEGFSVAYGAHGQRSHYGPERYGLPAGLHWVVWNRDPNRHEHNGLVSWSGLSWEQKRRVAEIHFGSPDAIDDPAQAYHPGPPTPERIELARMLVVRSMLKDSLTLCDWVFPNYCCPHPEREYAGDLNLEAELYEAITGEQATPDELDRRAEATVDLYRALTMRSWNTADMRGGAGYEGGGRGHDGGGDYRGHDNLAAWYFESEEETDPRLDRDQFEEAKTRFYERLGWDAQTGAVTRHKLESLGQASVADGLAALGLLPGA